MGSAKLEIWESKGKILLPLLFLHLSFMLLPYFQKASKDSECQGGRL